MNQIEGWTFYTFYVFHAGTSYFFEKASASFKYTKERQIADSKGT